MKQISRALLLQDRLHIVQLFVECAEANVAKMVSSQVWICCSFWLESSYHSPSSRWWDVALAVSGFLFGLDAVDDACPTAFWALFQYRGVKGASQ